MAFVEGSDSFGKARRLEALLLAGADPKATVTSKDRLPRAEPIGGVVRNLPKALARIERACQQEDEKGCANGSVRRNELAVR